MGNKNHPEDHRDNNFPLDRYVFVPVLFYEEAFVSKADICSVVGVDDIVLFPNLCMLRGIFRLAPNIHT